MPETELVTKDKYFLERMFPNIPGVDHNLLQITNEGVYSMSGVVGSCFMADLIIRHMNTRNITITDGTGNNGSETIVYGLLFKHVNSIELNPVNFDVLKNNISVYKLDNVTPIHGDTIDELKHTQQDVIVIDAPWGGPDYDKHESVRLFMSDLELSEIVNKFMDRAKLFVLKVPKNYDLNHFVSQLDNVKNLEIHNYIVPKNNKLVYRIIVLNNTQNNQNSNIQIGKHSIDILNKMKSAKLSRSKRRKIKKQKGGRFDYRVKYIQAKQDYLKLSMKN